MTRRVVRLWWDCSLCRYRFDTFGLSHDDPDDQAAAAWEVLDHLHASHDLTPDRLPEAVALLRPGHATSRVVRTSVIVDR